MKNHPDDPDRLSVGDIANIFGALIEREKRPEDALRLLEEINARIRNGEPIQSDSHLAEYFYWAVRRLKDGYDAEDAFGLTKRQHRPPENSERDELIAFMVQKRLNTGRYESEDAAALAVRDMLMESTPEFSLSHDRIRNIYRERKDDPLIQLACRF